LYLGGGREGQPVLGKSWCRALWGGGAGGGEMFAYLKVVPKGGREISISEECQTEMKKKGAQL